MRLRNLLGAVVGVTMLAAGSTAFATAGGASAPAQPDSLRALAAQVGLRVGHRHHPVRPGQRRVLRQIAADQFSVVTPGQRDEVAGGRADAGHVRLVRR